MTCGHTCANPVVFLFKFVNANTLVKGSSVRSIIRKNNIFLKINRGYVVHEHVLLSSLCRFDVKEKEI